MALDMGGAGAHVQHQGAAGVAPGRQRGHVDLRHVGQRRMRGLPGAVGGVLVGRVVGEPAHLPAHLGQPVRRHGGAHAVAGGAAIGQGDAGTAHCSADIGFLHELATRRAAETGQVAGGVFLGRAHVPAVQGAGGVGFPGGQAGDGEAHCAGAVSQRLGRRLRCGQVGGADAAKAPLRAMVQHLPGQQPADGAVAQRRHRVGDAGVHQALGADDAAGAAGTVDDHPGGRVRRQVSHPQRQLGAGHAGAAGDAHRGVFVEAAGVQHHHVGLRVQQGLHLLGRQAGRVPLVLDQFAEALAGHVDIAEQLAAGVTPAGQAANEQVHPGVAQGLQLPRGGRGQAFAVVVDGDGHVAPRQPPGRVQRDAAGADLHRPQRVGLGERVFLAHVDQGDLGAVEQQLPHLGGGQQGDVWRGHAPSFERSHRLGSMALL